MYNEGGWLMAKITKYTRKKIYNRSAFHPPVPRMILMHVQMPVLPPHYIYISHLKNPFSHYTGPGLSYLEYMCHILYVLHV